jgi:hypothetical protein
VKRWSRPRRRGDVLEFERVVATSHLTPDQARTVRSFIGGDRSKYAAGVRGNRLLQIQGPTARAVLGAWKEPAPAPPPPALAAAMARTRGSDLLLVVDPMPFLLQLLDHANDPETRQGAAMLKAIPGVQAVRTPLVAAVSSSGVLGYELQIPLFAFQSLAAWARPYMGTMGAPPR